jgi:hypothetical protein
MASLNLALNNYFLETINRGLSGINYVLQGSD